MLTARAIARKKLARDPNGIDFEMLVSIASNDSDKRDCP